MSEIEKFEEYESDFELKDLWRIISDYKIFISIVTLTFLIVTAINTYSKPPKYSSYSIIEVKTASNNNKEITNTNDLLQNVFHSNYKNINKEIEILKTYQINKKVIDIMNFKVQFFIEDRYKKREIYDKEIPIEIKNIKIYDKKIIGKLIKVTLEDNGYHLELERPKLIDKILKLKKSKIDINNTGLNPYGKSIETEYFELSLTKLNSRFKTIFFKINGDSRDIYENIIKHNLIIEQLNKDTPLIKISYEDSVPQRTTDYINNLVNIFIEEEKRNKDQKANETLKFIENQLKSVKAKLDNAEKRLRDYKVKNNIINLSSQSQIIIKKLNDIEIEISENRITNILIDTALRAIKKNRDFKSIMAILTKLDNSGIIFTIKNIDELKQKERKLKREYTDRYPELIETRREIAKLKRDLILNIENLKISINQKINSLEREKAMYERKLLTFPKKEIVQINLKSKYDINSQLYLYLLQKREESKMMNVALSAIKDYKIVERAYTPTSSIKQKGVMKTVASTLIGFIVAVILAVIMNILNSRVNSLRDIKRREEWLFSAEIPPSSIRDSNKNFEIEVFKNPKSKFTESYRRVRTDLEFILESDKSYIILVTSTIPQEGKNMVVVNLGAIFQLTRFKKSIIVDLDLREPKICKYFDLIGCDIGVSRYLNGQIENIDDIIFKTKEPYLDVIPAGVRPENPSELLISKKLDILFYILKSKGYDYIIVNSPSINVSLPDIITLSRYSHINIFVFRRLVSKKHFIKKIEEIISKYRLKNYVMVINDSKKKREEDEI